MDDGKPGWVKLHRKIRQSAVFDEESGALFKLWVYLLTEANWDTRQLSDGTILEPGQLTRGYRRMAEDLRWGRTKIERWIRRLVRLENITLTPRSGTLPQVITICNWALYQGDDDDSGTLAGRKRDTSGDTSGTLAGTKRRSKEVKKVRSEEKTGGSAAFSPADVELPEVLNTPQFRESWKTWVQARIEMKAPLTPTAVKLQLKKLAAWGSTRASAALDHTGSSTWKGIREPETPPGTQTRPRVDVDAIMRQKAAEAGEEYPE